MTDVSPPAYDYSTGIPRHHHSLYLEEGNFVIQVENAIFKAHRYFLAKYSDVLMEMLNAPQMSDNSEGTEEKPLILVGDSAASWELLLGMQYDSPRFSSTAPSGEHMLSILPIAHKYCMEKVEGDIIMELRKASRTPDYVDLMVAAQIVGSDELYQQALKGLITSYPKPDLGQARRIGVDVHHAVMAAALTSANAAHTTTREALQKANVNVDNTRCKSCNRHTGWKCTSCRTVQTPPPAVEMHEVY